MPIETWTHTYTVAAAPNTVYEYLAEPTHYLNLSPLIIAVSDIQHRHDADGSEQLTYRSVERFNFAGFIRYDNPIEVVMTLARSESRIISDVYAPLNLNLRFVFDLSPHHDNTQITETITIHLRQLGVLRGFIVGQAKLVQKYRAATLNTVFGDAIPRAEAGRL